MQTMLMRWVIVGILALALLWIGAVAVRGAEIGVPFAVF